MSVHVYEYVYVYTSVYICVCAECVRACGGVCDYMNLRAYVYMCV